MENGTDDEHTLEVYFGNRSFRDVVEMFLNRVPENRLLCVDRLGKKSLRLYFHNSINVNMFLRQPFVNKNRDICIFRIGEKLETVFVKGLPFNLPEKFIFDAIKKFGRVRSIGYERYPDHRPLRTGSRIVKMKLDIPVPNFLRVGRYMALVCYKNQVMVCRRCGGKGHIAKVCNTPSCDFHPGFPVHFRPVTARLGNLPEHPTNSASVEVQTVESAPNIDLTASGQNSIEATTSALAQELNGLQLEGCKKSSEVSASSSSPAEESQKKDKEGGCKEIGCGAEDTVNQDTPVGACAKLLTLVTLAGDSIVPDVTETEEIVTTLKKKQKKKKKTKKKNKKL